MIEKRVSVSDSHKQMRQSLLVPIITQREPKEAYLTRTRTANVIETRQPGNANSRPNLLQLTIEASFARGADINKLIKKILDGKSSWLSFNKDFS